MTSDLITRLRQCNDQFESALLGDDAGLVADAAIDLYDLVLANVGDLTAAVRAAHHFQRITSMPDLCREVWNVEPLDPEIWGAALAAADTLQRGEGRA